MALPTRAGTTGVDIRARTGYESRVVKKAESSRIPAAVIGIPVVGDLVRSADAQAHWMQDVLEQNARLVGQFPATMKTFNDALERFNETIGRLDRAVTRIEGATKNILGPLERVANAVDPKTLRELPETLDLLRREAIPALRAATDTQRQVTLLQTTLERVISAVGDLPGAGFVRRLTGWEDDEQPTTPRPPATSRTSKQSPRQGNRRS